jgi:hypothetical protein
MIKCGLKQGSARRSIDLDRKSTSAKEEAIIRIPASQYKLRNFTVITEQAIFHIPTPMSIFIVDILLYDSFAALGTFQRHSF